MAVASKKLLPLRDRTKFVQIAHHSRRTGTYRDMSATVLRNHQSQLLADEPSLGFDALKANIELYEGEIWEGHREARQQHYTTLLNAYFTATYELDMIARNEPDCSEQAKQLIVDRIAVYANPTRDLLLRMTDSLTRGQYCSFQKEADQLMSEWGAPSAAMEAQAAFAISQADYRVQILLTQQGEV